ncbi:MAG: hypothetical protein GY786_03835 [Proteobacteria bacterium]|nr:hypothetical protein [Pseudomonadota bacterium]
MKKVFETLVILLFFIGAAEARYNPRYDEYITKNNVKNFVKEAVAFAHIYGKKVALKEYKDKKGLFNRGELYIYAYDNEGIVLSHGANAAIIGRNLSQLKDTNGTKIIQRMIEKLKSQGEGWLRYYWFHPKTHMITPKLGYFEKVNENWWVGSGSYLAPGK